MPPKITFYLRLTSSVLILCLLAGCHPTPATPTPTPDYAGYSETEYLTLNSLEKLDDYPLYVMRMSGDYPPQASLPTKRGSPELAAPNSTVCQPTWGCSLFATLSDEGDRLYGRNFDWRFSPALLLYTNPPGAFASVSMVDITYLGFDGEPSKKLADLPLKQRRALLQAPFLPFDGMNEKGLAVGMAAVPPGDMTPDPQKETIDQLVVIREILDHAATVDEAIRILGSYNIEMGEVPIHYLIASVLGNSALVEFHQGQMIVTRNELPWQQATNFLVAATNDSPAGVCWRYDLIAERLNKNGGQMTAIEGLNLLADVSQPGTQWSIVYDMTSGEVQVIMGKNYAGKVHVLKFNR
jgi:hypothetical protein